MLDPRGPKAAEIAELWWIIFTLGMAVFAVTMALLMFALLRRHGRSQREQRRVSGNTFIVVAGIIILTAILAFLFVLTAQNMAVLSQPDEPPDLLIEVNGQQFWWEVHYPSYGVTTANEIHIPVNQPVQIRLTSEDVIHSFWVPQLSGKTDLVPGDDNTMWLEANRPGVYLGKCNEFCGIQHAKMQFHVIAEPHEEFAAWIEMQQQPARTPSAPVLQQGQQVYLTSGCVECHTIRGLPGEGGDLGPDLTHIGSRGWLAAGTLENTRGNMAAWVANPQAIKQGTQMPSQNIGSEELLALVSYLESLE